MSSVVVGGLPIRVSPDSISTDRDDGVDRSRRFDNSYSASKLGGVARDFHFTTPPVSATDFQAYMAVLSQVQPQTCSGDIIGIPTMCCAETPTWTPKRSQGANYYVVSFTLHEVQSDRVLLRYTPGDTITGETFTRSTIAEFQGGSGAMGSAAINVKRDQHFIGGLLPQRTLLEGPGTNSVLRTADFVNAAWTKVSMTATNGTADPAGGTTACTLTATGASAQAFQILATGASIVRTNSCWIRRRTGAGAVTLSDPNDTPHAVSISSTWTRFSFSGSASINRIFDLVMATSGDAIDVWMPQLEDATQPSSEIATTTVAVTRGADAYSLPFTIPPGELTVYVKFVELGTAFPVGRLFSITNAAGAAPHFDCFGLAGVYTAYHNNGTAVVTSALAASVAVGNVIELSLHLYGDGSVDITQSINGGAATSSVQSAANAMATAWAGPLLWLNSLGSTVQTGYAAFQSFKIVAGARSLPEMRAA